MAHTAPINMRPLVISNPASYGIKSEGTLGVKRSNQAVATTAITAQGHADPHARDFHGIKSEGTLGVERSNRAPAITAITAQGQADLHARDFHDALTTLAAAMEAIFEAIGAYLKQMTDAAAITMASLGAQIEVAAQQFKELVSAAQDKYQNTIENAWTSFAGGVLNAAAGIGSLGGAGSFSGRIITQAISGVTKATGDIATSVMTAESADLLKAAGTKEANANTQMAAFAKRIEGYWNYAQSLVSTAMQMIRELVELLPSMTRTFVGNVDTRG